MSAFFLFQLSLVLHWKITDRARGSLTSRSMQNSCLSVKIKIFKCKNVKKQAPAPVVNSLSIDVHNHHALFLNVSESFPSRTLKLLAFTGVCNRSRNEEQSVKASYENPMIYEDHDPNRIISRIRNRVQKKAKIRNGSFSMRTCARKSCWENSETLSVSKLSTYPPPTQTPSCSPAPLPHSRFRQPFEPDNNSVT